MPFVQVGYIFILNKHINNNLCFIEEYFDERDITNIANAKCVIRLSVSSERAFNRHISYETGQILWTPKSEFMRCQVLSIEFFHGYPLLHCSWKTSKFIADLD